MCGLTSEVALGVGTKAIPALTSPTEEEDDFSGLSPRGAVYTSAKEHMPTKVGTPKDGQQNVRSSLLLNQSYSSSALHSIMEQGMLVAVSCL